jgi:hypothetical protein
MAERELSATDWRAYAGEQFPAKAWSVDGDVLRAMASGPRVDLLTRERFGDFALSFDWRLPRAGNAAVGYRIAAEGEAASLAGPAMQLLDDEHHRDGTNALTSCGALYALMAPWHERRAGANHYHSARIVVRGTRVEHWIDERQVVGCDLAAEELRERIARSRFRDCRGFGLEPEGHIVLQHRGTEAWFRKLRIEIL